MKERLAGFLRGLADALDPLPPELPETETGVDVPEPQIVPYRERLAAEVIKTQYVSDKYTYCNFFTRAVCSWFGWNKFSGRELDQAGEIAAFLEKGDPMWREIKDMHEARDWAMKERLLIAAQVNTDKPDGKKWIATGHVCIIAPEGELVYSKKWGRKIPKVANVGRVNSYGKGLNWAFKEMPKVYLYLGNA